LALFKSLDFNKRDSFRFLIKEELEATLTVVRESLEHDKTRYFECLDLLDDVLRLKQLEIWPYFDAVEWIEFVGPLSPEKCKQFFSVFYFACGWFLHEYVAWRIQKCPQILEDTHGADFLYAMIEGCYLGTGTVDQCSASLGVLFRCGVSPMCNGVTRYWDYSCIWVGVLNALGQKASNAQIWKAIEVFLEFGANLPIFYGPSGNIPGRIELQEHDVLKSRKEDETFAAKENGRKLGVRGSGSLRQHLWYCNVACLPKQLRRKGCKASLQDFVEIDFPKNMETIQKLLEKIPTRYYSPTPEPATHAYTDRPLSASSQTFFKTDSERTPLLKTEPFDSGIRSNNLFWTTFKDFLKNRTLPWILLGTSPDRQSLQLTELFLAVILSYLFAGRA
jgi:hypothetical protein